VSPAPGYEVLWTATAFEMLAEVADRRVRQQLFETSKRLQADPEKQGKPLREGLMGFRSLRVVGQRYRLVYSVDPDTRLVHVVAAGLRREGSRDDVYELAQRIVRLGLTPASRKRETSQAPRRHQRKQK
jgi:mRNA interferase RelE/StbE